MLSQEDISQLKEMFVLKDDCNDRHTEANKEITEIKVVQAQISTRLGILIAVNSAMLAAVGAAIVGAIMKLIVK